METECVKKNLNQIVDQYTKSGIQYGHKSKDWNPQMAPYILRKKDANHIFDLIKTSKFLKLAGYIIKKKSSQGKSILFVGTSKDASNVLASALKNTQIFYINYRWLGGMLTNWSTLKKRIQMYKNLCFENLSEINQNDSKKIVNKRRKTLERLKRLFEGIQEMKRLPDLIVFASQIKEKVALFECHKLGIPTICITDSNSNPDITPYFIPANDDALKSLNFILQHLIDQIIIGQNNTFTVSLKSKNFTTFPYKSMSLKEKLFSQNGRK